MTLVENTIVTALKYGHKRQRLTELAQKRRENTPENVNSIADFYCGAYDTEWVSPYTKSASNLNATVMVLLQDWASSEYLSKAFKPELVALGLDTKLPTSRQLTALLARHFSLRLEDTFATNLYPYIKSGSLSAAMTWQGLVDSAKRYALPQVNIVAPQVVICLGLNVFNALSVANGGARYKRLGLAIQSPFAIALESGQCCYVYAQAHTGFHGQTSRNRGDSKQVELDWAHMSEQLAMAV
ncbi:hypothetical protein [Photobacterium kagoshimensis]|uniref:hypothetical protein n=1 Tax=Photobacterium kagoshimensis TaxID=2910242 RepID=UPI003D0C5A57